LGAAALAFTGPFLAGSRMAILLIPLGVLGVGWPVARQMFQRATGKLLISLGALLLAMAVAFSLFGSQTNFRSVADTEQNHDRIFIWERAVEIFVDKPVFGTGYGHYPIVAPSLYHTANPKRPAKNHAHNVFLTLLAETGLVGFWAFWWMIGCFFRQTRQAPLEGMARGAFWACIMFFLVSLVHDPLFQSNSLTCFWLFACLAAVPIQKGEANDSP
jgi:O-antigen ligase